MFRKVLIFPIRVYQRVLSPLLPNRCRFYPTCSDYTIEAVMKHGIVTGLWLGLKRICRCHPWNLGGVDPVPDHKK